MAEQQEASVEASLHEQSRIRSSTNGLRILKELGMPEGAVTTLLIVLAALTAVPYVAGREFGPYSIPNVLQGGTFWFLAVFTPLVWIALVAPVFRSDWTTRRRVLITTLAVEAIAVFVAFGSYPTSATTYFRSELKPGEPSEPFMVQLPAVGRAIHRLDVTIEELDGVDRALPNGFGVWLDICGAAETENCKGEQKGKNDTVVRFFQRGSVRISVFNYETNPRIKVLLRATHLKRRWF